MLDSASDEARQEIVTSATIPAHGTVREGLSVVKSGQLVMIFDNTVRVTVNACARKLSFSLFFALCSLFGARQLFARLATSFDAGFCAW